MNTHTLMLAVFIAGVGSGWIAKSWLGTGQSIPTDLSTGYRQSSNNGQRPDVMSITDLSGSHNDIRFDNPVAQGSFPSLTSETRTQTVTGDSALATLKRLLSDRRFNDGVMFYQQQLERGNNTAYELKRILIEKLQQLINTRNNSDFSELIESYLSIYYDDIEVLLLLADFNQVNGSYLEVVDVFLLASTYAYTNADKLKVTTRFNDFVQQTDAAYTEQKNWWSLVNLYAHIDTSGLMSSTHQYRQALAHLRSGDEAFAVEQFNQLLGDSLVGESAALVLNSLTNSTETPSINNTAVPDSGESIALQNVGNQYLVSLTNNHSDSVPLLIDTGASMTAMSSASFNTLNRTGDATLQERRVFHTAGGMISGAVYLMPELALGTYVLRNTQIAVIEFDTNRDIDGLLGMNILGQFRFQIDQENSRLILNKK